MAHVAVKETIAGYPDAAEFIKVSEAMQGLYRRMRQQMSEFKQECEVLHQRSEDANAILDRLKAERSSDASNPIEAEDESADKVVGTMSSSYPGEEADPDDSDIGKPIKDESAGSADPR
jgi:hypothetical protein